MNSTQMALAPANEGACVAPERAIKLPCSLAALEEHLKGLTAEQWAGIASNRANFEHLCPLFSLQIERCCKQLSLTASASRMFYAEDLRSHTMLALWHLLPGFDPQNGADGQQRATLKTYVSNRLYNRVIDLLRCEPILKRNQANWCRELYAARAEATQALGYTPPDDDTRILRLLAGDPKASPDHPKVQLWKERLARLKADSGPSLDDSEVLPGHSPLGDGQSGTMRDLLGDPAALTATLRLHEPSDLQLWSSRLPLRERECLALTLDQGLQLEEVGKLMSLHGSRISQILGLVVRFIAANQAISELMAAGPTTFQRMMETRLPLPARDLVRGFFQRGLTHERLIPRLGGPTHAALGRITAACEQAVTALGATGAARFAPAVCRASPHPITELSSAELRHWRFALERMPPTLLSTAWELSWTGMTIRQAAQYCHSAAPSQKLGPHAARTLGVVGAALQEYIEHPARRRSGQYEAA